MIDLETRDDITEATVGQEIVGVIIATYVA